MHESPLLRTAFCTIVAVLLMVLGSGVVAEAEYGFDTTPGATGATRVFLPGPQSLTQLGAVVVGQGIAGTAPKEVLTPLGEIRWKVLRSFQDDLPTEHVFYGQYLLPNGDVSELLDPEYAVSGITLQGAILTAHSRSGAPYLAEGAQFSSFSDIALPTIGCATEAFNTTLELLVDWPGYEAAEPGTFSEELAEQLLATTKLVLVGSQAAPNLIFAWDVAVRDANGFPYRALLDASNIKLLAVTSTTVTSACAPQYQQTRVAAVGVPQNPAIPNRALFATTATDRPSFTHQAHGKFGQGEDIPFIDVYHGTTNWNYECYVPRDSFDSALVGLNAHGGVPYFEDWTTPEPLYQLPFLDRFTYPGRAAGDAMWFTSLTMKTFREQFSWPGWDGQGGIPSITVNARSERDNPEFTPYGYPGLPNSVNVGTRYHQEYSYAASLDVIAHEWTHGAQTACGLTYAKTTAQLMEGLADVMGYAVEAYEQPVGQGPELSGDWTLGEDNPPRDLDPGPALQLDPLGRPYIRRVDQPYSGERDLFLFHRRDRPEVTEQHARGNVLAVAYKVMVDGGYNPDCRFNNCTKAIAPIGLERASQIMFRTMTQYMSDNTDWNQFVNLAQAAAFAYYQNCSGGYSATVEQGAVRAAFNVTGYVPAFVHVFSCE